jgi:FkbM family methyltransferase
MSQEGDEIMWIFKKMVIKIGKTILSVFLKKKMQLGGDTYARRLVLPNLLSGPLAHDECLDDIYRAVLKRKEGAIIDVGANTGQTLYKMLSIDRNRPYFGFEPQCMAASCVESFLIENKITNYCILPIALSDHNGSIPINIRGDGIYSMACPVASIVDGFRPRQFYNYTRRIYAARGDEIIESLGITSIAVIKIDVEGAELEVMRGLRATLARYRPFVVFEVLHHYVVVTNEELDKETIDFRESRIGELEEIIRMNKYCVYQVNGDKEILRINRIKPKVVNDLTSKDFIAVPEEEESGFCQLLEGCRNITTS